MMREKKNPRIPPLAARLRTGLRSDRNEFSGAFGDLGTDFPFLVGMVLVAGLDVSGALIMFGVMQILPGCSTAPPCQCNP